jgi:hypothetical protein
METIRRGNAAEAAVLNAFVQADIDVLLPFGGGCPFDLGVLLPPAWELVRVQVKSGRVRNGCVEFNAHSTDHGRGRLGYEGRADVFAVQVPGLPDIYIVTVADCNTTKGTLRLEATRNNQQKGVRFARDYTLEAWVNSMWERTGRSPAFAA